MTTDLPSFQRYQLAFTARLRDPINQPLPEGVPSERMDVYEEVVFNNIFESVSACFPVTQKVLGKKIWLKLTQAFLRDHTANTPIFRKIPEEFLAYIAAPCPEIQKLLPPYLISLCHYEWVELFVAFLPINKNVSNNIDSKGNLLKQQPVFTGSMQLLNYEYAVHKISPRLKPKAKESTQLLAYRNTDDNVKFIELNPVTFRLITLLQQDAWTGEQALVALAKEMEHPKLENIIQFGLGILEDLRSQGVILGTLTTY